MLSLLRPLRAAVPCALVAATVAFTAAPARAADGVLPALPVCIQAEGLPDIGTCPQEQPAEPPCADAGLVPTGANLSRIRAATLCLLNQERTSRGRKELRSQSTLAGVAKRYARQMVRERFFAHVSPGGSTMIARIRKTRYLDGPLARWAVGENLAWATSRLATPEKTVRAWMDSPGHRRNLLNRSYTEIGIGVVSGIPTGDAAGATYVTEFGQRIRR